MSSPYPFKNEVATLSHREQAVQLVDTFESLKSTDTGVLDYASTAAREELGKIDAALLNLGMQRIHVQAIVAKAFHDLDALNMFGNYMQYVEDAGDLGVEI